MGYVFALHSPQEEAYKPSGAPVGSSSPDARVVAALRGNDETVLGQLLERYQRTMLRVALNYVSSLAVAEEVVQETWISFLQSLDRLVMLSFNIFGEELWWRGYILPRQEEAYGRWTWAVHGLLWLLWHVAFYPWQVFALLLICLTVPYIAQRRQNIWPAIIIHWQNGIVC